MKDQNTRGIVTDDEPNNDDKLLEKLHREKMPSTNHLLVIGIDDYQGEFRTLNNAVKDAEAFEQLMLEQYRFERKNIIHLYNDQANKDNILEALDNLQKTLTDDDTLVIYFAGHGEFHELNKRGYWIPYGARKGKRGDFIIDSELHTFMEISEARHVLGIIDSCYSGSIFDRGEDDIFELTGLYNNFSRYCMTSGQKERVPDGYEGHHSPFAKVLLRTLKTNREPFMGATDLWVVMRRALLRLKRTYPKASTPRYEVIGSISNLGGEYFFIQKDADIVPVRETTSKSKQQAAPKESTYDPQPQAQYLNSRSGDSPSASTKQSLEQIQDELKKLLVKDLGKAFRRFEEIIQSRTEVRDNLLLLEGRYTSNRNEFNMGMLTHQDYTRGTNQIVYAMLQIINNLEEEDLK